MIFEKLLTSNSPVLKKEESVDALFEINQVAHGLIITPDVRTALVRLTPPDKSQLPTGIFAQWDTGFGGFLDSVPREAHIFIDSQRFDIDELIADFRANMEPNLNVTMTELMEARFEYLRQVKFGRIKNHPPIRSMHLVLPYSPPEGPSKWRTDKARSYLDGVVNDAVTRLERMGIAANVLGDTEIEDLLRRLIDPDHARQVPIQELRGQDEADGMDRAHSALHGQYKAEWNMIRFGERIGQHVIWQTYSASTNKVRPKVLVPLVEELPEDSWVSLKWKRQNQARVRQLEAEIEQKRQTLRLDTKRGETTPGVLERSVEHGQQVMDVLLEGDQPYDFHGSAMVWAYDEQTLEDRVAKVKSLTSPAIEAATLRGEHQVGLKNVMPFGYNIVSEGKQEFPTRYAALLNPLSSSQFYMPGPGRFPLAENLRSGGFVVINPMHRKTRSSPSGELTLTNRHQSVQGGSGTGKDIYINNLLLYLMALKGHKIRVADASSTHNVVRLVSWLGGSELDFTEGSNTIANPAAPHFTNVPGFNPVRDAVTRLIPWIELAVTEEDERLSRRHKVQLDLAANLAFRKCEIYPTKPSTWDREPPTLGLIRRCLLEASHPLADELAELMLPYVYDPRHGEGTYAHQFDGQTNAKLDSKLMVIKFPSTNIDIYPLLVSSAFNLVWGEAAYQEGITDDRAKEQFWFVASEFFRFKRHRGAKAFIELLYRMGRARAVNLIGGFQLKQDLEGEFGNLIRENTATRVTFPDIAPDPEAEKERLQTEVKKEYELTIAMLDKAVQARIIMDPFSEKLLSTHPDDVPPEFDYERFGGTVILPEDLNLLPSADNGLELIRAIGTDGWKLWRAHHLANGQVPANGVPSRPY